MGLLSTASNFTQLGKGRWRISGFDLDQLVVRMQGPESAKNSYIGGLTTWAAAAADGNMFLEGWSDDDHEYKPTVELIYSGKKGGTTSSTLRKNNSTTRQAAAFTDNTGSGSIQIQVEFQAPTNTATTIEDDATMPAPDSVGSVSYSDFSYVLIKITGDYSIVGSIMDLFSQVTVVSTDSQEVVKGQYYRNTKTNTLALQPVL